MVSRETVLGFGVGGTFLLGFVSPAFFLVSAALFFYWVVSRYRDAR